MNRGLQSLGYEYTARLHFYETASDAVRITAINTDGWRTTLGINVTVLPAPKPGGAVVALRATLYATLETFAEEAFRRKVAEVLGLDPTDVVVLDTFAGSMIVQFCIRGVLTDGSGTAAARWGVHCESLCVIFSLGMVLCAWLFDLRCASAFCMCEFCRSGVLLHNFP